MLRFEKLGLYVVLGLAVLGLVLSLLRLYRRKRARIRLEEDATGFWRYHKETQFLRKVSYKRFPESDEEEKKEEQKKDKPQAIAVIHFDGDLRCRQHKTLSRLVDEVEVNKELLSEVVIVLNSPGGLVSQYGHAFSQMERIRNMELTLTVCIDVVAASGGYLMSLPAHKIVAAPFAIVGSIGVMAFVPNFRRMLLNWDINPRTFVSGKYKRTVSLTDEETPEQVARFQNQIEAIQRLFLGALKKYREHAKYELIETGDHWTAQESVEAQLGLVDEISTSEEYLLRKNKEHDLLLLSQKRSLWGDGLDRFTSATLDKVEERLYLLAQGF